MHEHVVIPLRGSGECQMGLGTTLLRFGDVAYVAPLDPHQARRDGRTGSNGWTWVDISNHLETCPDKFFFCRTSCAAAPTRTSRSASSASSTRSVTGRSPSARATSPCWRSARPPATSRHRRPRRRSPPPILSARASGVPEIGSETNHLSPGCARVLGRAPSLGGPRGGEVGSASV